MRKGGGLVLLCAALGIVILCGLGVWQVQRLQWKTALIEQLSARLAAKPVALAEALKSAGDLEYLRVVVDALPETHRVLLKQATYKSEAGFEGVAGFRTSDGIEVLVDLGGSAQALTEVQGPAHFEALIRKHNLGQGRFDPANNVAGNKWFWWDLPAMQKALGLNSPAPVVLQLVGAHDGSGYEPAEPKVELNNNHLGYAITWFGLAMALAGVAGAFVFGREQR